MFEGMMVPNWVALNVPYPMKFTAFIGESVEKINQFPANMEVFKIIFELERKRLLEKIYIF